jgi:hypothetical protein
MLLAQKERQGNADADELGQRQIDENYAALQNVDAEIGVDHDEQKTGQKRVSKKIESFHDFSGAVRR